MIKVCRAREVACSQLFNRKSIARAPGLMCCNQALVVAAACKKRCGYFRIHVGPLHSFEVFMKTGKVGEAPEASAKHLKSLRRYKQMNPCSFKAFVSKNGRHFWAALSAVCAFGCPTRQRMQEPVPHDLCSPLVASSCNKSWTTRPERR